MLLCCPDVGAFLESERLFSIIAALLNPSPSLAAPCIKAGDQQIESYESHFEHHDSDYCQSELSTARKQIRGPAPEIHAKDCKLEVLPRATLPAELSAALKSSSGDASLLVLGNCVLYSIKRLCLCLEWDFDVADLTYKFRVGVWYRLLTAGLRLLRNLSTRMTNHDWLLEQGAPLAVAKILQYLPADRMRGGQQEAALFLYHIFEDR